MHSKSASFCNMAVMKKDDFDKYCKWLFELLEKYESRVDLSGYTKQEQRIYGFMSEFLLNVWIKKENKSSIHWDIVNIQTPEYGGGEIWFDDVLIMKDGRFILKELECLNPEEIK